MKVSDLVQVRRAKEFSAQGRGKYVYTVDVLGTEVTADSKEEAIQEAIGLVRGASAHQGDRRYYWSKTGAVFCLYYAYGSWRYDIAKPDGSCLGSTCILGSKFRFHEAREMVQRHLGQYDE